MANIDAIFKAMGNPTRIKIIQMLAENGELCVCKILEGLEMTQPALSHHLSTLKNAGLVSPRKQGQWIHYTLVKSAFVDEALPFIQSVINVSSINSNQKIQI
ncbi:MAG: ArsR/SmtB family transcription factor [Armatimonadota bacterium]